MRRTRLAVLAFASCYLSACDVSPWGGAAPPEPEIVYDYRSLVDVQDLSGLEAGTHAVEFDVYVPRSESWSESREQQLRDGLHAAHVDSRTPVTPRVSFTPVEGRADLRRARVELDLDRPGAWVLELSGRGLYPAQRDWHLVERYDIRQSETLEGFERFADLSPQVLLRTVGTCNHVHRMKVLSDAADVPRQLELSFTEPLPRQAWTDAARMALVDETGATVSTVTPGVARLTDQSVVFDIPEGFTRLKWGRIQLSLGATLGIAGQPGARFSCAPAEAVVDVGYSPGSQPSRTHLVAPLQQASAFAFVGPK